MDTAHRSLTSRTTIAEGTASAAQSDVMRYADRNKQLEQQLALAREEAETANDSLKRWLEANEHGDDNRDGLSYGDREGDDDNDHMMATSSARENANAEQLESLLAERTSQCGVLMETVEALQTALSSRAARGVGSDDDGVNHNNGGANVATAANAQNRSGGGGFGDNLGGDYDEEVSDEKDWAMRAVLKRIAKVTVECTAISSAAGMHERRSLQLRGALSQAEKWGHAQKKARLEGEKLLEESRAARAAGAAELVKLRADWRVEVGCVLVVVVCCICARITPPSFFS